MQYGRKTVRGHGLGHQLADSTGEFEPMSGACADEDHARVIGVEVDDEVPIRCVGVKASSLPSRLRRKARESVLGESLHGPEFAGR